MSIGVRQLIASNSWIKNQTHPGKQGMKARFNWDSMSYLPIHIRYHSFKKDQKGRLLMIREKLWTTSCPSKPKEKLKKNINVPKRASPWCRGRLRLPDSTIAQKKNTQKPGASNVTHNLQPFILCNLHTKELKQSKIHLKNGRFNHWPCLNSIIDVRNDSDALWTYQSSDLRVFSWATGITRLSYSCIMVT